MSSRRPRYLTREEVVAELEGIFPHAAVYVLDAEYNVVTRQAVARFGVELELELARHGVRGWDEAFDCEDLSAMAWVGAKVKHLAAKSRGVAVRSGVAVGWMCYLVEGSIARGHAINLFRTSEGWQGWEPQTRQFVGLAQVERRSTWMICI